MRTDDAAALSQLLTLMARLRDRDHGCPWDLEQTFHSIAPYTIEEAYEVADAIEREDMDDLKSELGDLLFQVVFHARMAEEQGAFTFADVAAAITEKMIRRHPHVFDAPDGRDAETQTKAWEVQKAVERKERGAIGLLDDVPVALPGLTRAVKLQARAARVGFDWPNADRVIEKLVEEAGELAAARSRRAPDEIEDEFGDLLFVVANLARHLRVDPEASLRRANEKFTRRFRHIEKRLAEQGVPWSDSSLDQMEALWLEAKAIERAKSEQGA